MAAAGLMILGGLVLLSPFATSQPGNEPQRKARRRMGLTVFSVAPGMKEADRRTW
jgi:hypothetical protein